MFFGKSVVTDVYKRQMLLTYGNEKETLENFVKEMTDTLGSIRNAAQEEDVYKRQLGDRYIR